MGGHRSLTVDLADEAATLALGGMLGTVLADPATRAALLFFGELGAGKTTLVRGLVAALPGGDEAEVASPSFNLVNVYPTRPEVYHIDLYRLPGPMADPMVEEHLEAAAASGAVVAVEWAELLSPEQLPAERLTLTWLPAKAGRRVLIEAKGGQAAEAALARLEAWLGRTFRGEGSA